MVLQVGRNSAANTDYTKMEEWAKTNTKNRQKKKKWFQVIKESSRGE